MDGYGVNQDLAALSFPNMEILSTILGLMLGALPFVLVAFAWKSAKRNRDAQVAWRKRMFGMALVGNALGYVWFWIVFLGLPRSLPYQIYYRIGWTSEVVALIVLALSFAGTGAARILAVLGSAGVAVLWVSVGFW